MSKMKDYLIGKLEDIEKASGYPFDFLQSRHETILQEFSRGELGTENTLDVLSQRADAKAWGEPETALKLQSIADNTGYDFYFLLDNFEQEVADGMSVDAALEYIENVSIEQDW